MKDINNKRKISSIEYIVIFVLVIVVVGIASFARLVNYYVNDVVDNTEWSAEMGSPFETREASSFLGKESFVNLNGLMRRIIGQREMNGVVKLDNGYLLQPIESTPEEDIELFADNISAVNNYCKENGVSLVYVGTPYTVSKFDNQLPEGIEDYGNENMDLLLSKLQNRGVDTIDIRQEMHDDGINQYDMMFRTDHHWTGRGGFYAYKKIEAYIEDKAGCEVDERVKDLSNYSITNHRKSSLGTRGQRTGELFAGKDDFEVIVPDFETDIVSHSTDGDERGSIEDLLIITTDCFGDKKYENGYVYDQVFSGSLGNFTNQNSKNDTKILVITDSFGEAVNPYLIMSFDTVETLRHSSYLTKGYIDDYKPDVIVIMWYTNAIQNGSGEFYYPDFMEE